MIYEGSCGTETWVNDAENSGFTITGINYFKNIFKPNIFSCNVFFFFFYNIPVLDCIFNQINEAINQKHNRTNRSSFER